MTFSRPVRSNQNGPHERLEEVVRRHLATRWRHPVRDHSRAAFDSLAAKLGPARELILDSGCGTGASTLNLADRHPGVAVVGVDRSAVRLGRAPRARPDRVFLTRAVLEDFWRLAAGAGWRISRHYLLYPNPWPKAAQFKRRWHAHPVFPALLALGGVLELRTNWETYAVEFAHALELAGVGGVKLVSFRPGEPLSPFERKYAASGHSLYRLTARLEV